MIRPTEPSDTEPLVAIAWGTGVFRDPEVEALREVLDDYHVMEPGHMHRSVTLLDDAGQVLGLAYYAQAAMTDRTWYLWWIIVEKARQSRGHGAALLQHAEAEVKATDGRLMLIETSSIPMYEPTRRFYLRHGYEIACVIPDYYADGDDITIFSKRLSPRESA